MIKGNVAGYSSARHRPGVLALGVSLMFGMLSLAAMAQEGHGLRGDKGQKLSHSQASGLEKRRGGNERRQATAVGCGDVLSTPGYYELVSDLTCTASIRITASNVHLDLKGHSVTCLPEAWEFPDPLGVPEEDRNVWVKGINVNFNDFEDPSLEPVISGVTIENGTISNCAQGILLYKADRTVVADMTLQDHVLDSWCCWSRGMEVVRSHNTVLKKNTLIRNHQGIAVFSSNGTEILNNEANGNYEDGVILFDSDGGVVHRNQVNDNTWGIWLQDGSDDNRISANETRRNTDIGITLMGPATGNFVRDNEAGENDVGFALFGLPQFGVPVPVDNVLKHNTALNNASIDAGEVNLIFTEAGLEIEPADQCYNDWQDNDFVAIVGPADCIE